MSTNGLLLPTSQGMAAGNPRDSAISSMKTQSSVQAQANSAMAGGKYRKYGGATNDIAVPQYNMAYTPTGGPGSNPNDIIKNNSQVSTQAYANSANDNLATTKGGYRIRKRGSIRKSNSSKYGGNSDWNWPCYSGGKRRGTKRKRSRKHRKSRRK
jgi:hypothetical protein